MKNLILFIAILLLFTGCITQSKCDRKFPPEVMVIRTDSIIHTKETIYRDSLIYIHLPGEKVKSTDTVYVVNGLVYSKKNYIFTSFAESWAWVENGRLYHELTQKDTLVGQEVKNAVRITWERAEKFYNGKEVQVKTVRYIPQWVWWCLGVSVLALLNIVIKGITILKI